MDILGCFLFFLLNSVSVKSLFKYMYTGVCCIHASYIYKSLSSRSRRKGKDEGVEKHPSYHRKQKDNGQRMGMLTGVEFPYIHAHYHCQISGSYLDLYDKKYSK